ncbi:hypothetical protein YC2023_036461 [Brassica napus]
MNEKESQKIHYSLSFIGHQLHPNSATKRRRRKSRCGRRRRGRRSRAADSSAAARRRRVASGAEETDSEQRRERKRRTPSSEREDSKSYRSGSRERGSGSRRVSRSPERRSETTNPNNGIGSSVNSSNNNNIPAKFVSVPATGKEKRSSNNNADASIKRVAVKRNVASPRSQSPARAASPRAQSPARINGVANKSLIAVGETNLILKKTIHHVSTMLKRGQMNWSMEHSQHEPKTEL